MAAFFPGLTQDDLPDGEGWAVERVELITHNGTHLDAPYHFASTMNNGERAIGIDEVPSIGAWVRASNSTSDKSRTVTS